MNGVPRRICVVTGTRAEYGLLSTLMRAIASDPALALQVVATGMHLSPEFGKTYEQIEKDGFLIDAKVEMLLSSDTSVGVAKSMGVGIIGLAEAFDRLRPHLVVLLGDRFEILAAAQAALVALIPIAHLHGGETTEGAFDESMRHAITKMSHFHFVAAESYRKRVIQLGEMPSSVFNVGAPGLDQLTRVRWLTRAELEGELGIALRHPTFLVTYHPTTLSELPPRDAVAELLCALDAFPEASVVFTYPNADTGGRGVIDAIADWVGLNAGRAVARASLGQQNYLSTMRVADVIIGNSSSGLTEAPALKKATVNIGDRQKGRLKASSVVDVPDEHSAIVTALQRVLSEEFQATLPATESLYGAGDVGERIKAVLKRVPLDVRKPFFDVAHDF